MVDNADVENTSMSGSTMAEEEAQEANRVINEEYKTWKKNAPFMYDLVVTHALDWPSLTLQWFPDKEIVPGKDYAVHRLLLGTHTSGNDQNYLKIATVQVPLSATDLDLSKYDDDKGEIGGYGGSQSRITVTQRIDHEGEVNKARYMPQNPDLIATMSVSGDVLIFDRTKHSNTPSGTCTPEMRLKGHTKEGWGMSWNPQNKGHLVTSSEDTTICYWDVVSNYSKQAPTMEPMAVYRTHSAIVNDVMWHPQHESLFGSVSDDQSLQIHDVRQSSFDKPARKVQNAHDAAINSLAFNPVSEYLLATGSGDTTIGLWDIRNLKTKLYTFEGHTGEVSSLQWSPHEETILASAAADRRLIIWDLAKIGEDQTPEDAEDGPPELLFMHGGHTNRISDFGWNLNDKWMLASASDDNIVHVFQPAANIYANEDDSVDDNELE